MKSEVKAVQTREKIFVPYNEQTAHIYETIARVAMDIVQRNQTNAEAMKAIAQK